MSITKKLKKLEAINEKLEANKLEKESLLCEKYNIIHGFSDLRDIPPETPKVHLLVPEIGAKYFSSVYKKKITIDALKSKCRKKDLVHARNVCYCAMRIFQGKNEVSLKSVGAIFNRCHSSVLNGISSVKNDIDTNKKYRELYQNQVNDIYNLILKELS